jgi:hypothetical protein
LVAFDLPGYKDDPRVIGWELFTGADFLTLVRKGRSASLDEAKHAAEAALAEVVTLAVGDQSRIRIA